MIICADGKSVRWRFPWFFFFSSRRRHTRFDCDWSSDVSSSDLERDALEPVSRKELSQRLRDGLVTVLDVRPEDEYAAGHVPKAINIPLRELTRRLRQIPKNREVVAYCRGPYCVLAFEAVAILRERGFKVRRLEDGYPEWKAAGLPTD